MLRVEEYDQAFTTRFVEELEKTSTGGALEMFVLDSVKLRDSVRACQGK